MATFQKFYQFSEDLAHGVHDFSADTIKIALIASVAPAQTNEVLANITANEIAYTNVSTSPNSGRDCGAPSVAVQTSGVYKLLFADMTITAVTGAIPTFRWIVLYNDTPVAPADPLIGYYDYGSNLDLALGETLLIDWDNTNGTFTIT